MGTKNNPGKFDCHANAAPDEPMFVLLGRDPTAALLVRLWCLLRGGLCGKDEDARAKERDKLMEAYGCADALENWAHALGKGEKVQQSREAFLAVCKDAIDGKEPVHTALDAALPDAEGK